MASSARTRARRMLSPRTGRRREPAGASIHGRARLGRKTKDLVKRLVPIDIAIIDHADIDRIAAEELIATGVRAVVNCSPSSTGRYPNPGPLLLVQAGVRLVDVPGQDLFEELRDGEEIEVDGGDVKVDGQTLVRGRRLGVAELAEQMNDLRERIDEALAAFAENTMAHIRQEGELLAGRIDFPPTRTDFRDRHVLIVVRGTTHRKDLRTLRAYIQDVRPLLVGVDGGADALLEAGLRPDVILGDMDSASDRALGSGAELIVHAYPDGRAPGRERLERLGLEHLRVPAPATSQDVAMLLAYEKGARLIVMVGAHFNLTEFPDKNRPGLSPTFPPRLRVGDIMVDAKGVSRLYSPGVAGGQFALVLAVFLVLLAIVLLTSPALDNLLELIWLKI